MKLSIALLFVALPLIFAVQLQVMKGSESSIAEDFTHCPNVEDARYPKGHLLKCVHAGAVCCPDGNYCCPPTYSCGAKGFCVRPSTAAQIGENSLPAVMPPSNPTPDTVTTENSAPDEVIDSQPLTKAEEEASAPAPVAEVPPVAGGTPATGTPQESSDNGQIVILKNVNSLYKGPPKNGAVAAAAPEGEESSAATSESAAGSEP